MKSNTPAAPFSLLACLWLALPAAAQPATEQVSMKIDLVAWGESISGLSLKAGKNEHPATALSFRYSKPVAYAGSNILEISRNTDAASQPAGADANADILPAIAARRKDNPNLVALAMLPSDSKRVTVLLAPASGGTFTAYVIDDDPSKLPLGRMRIHNLSPFPIAMRCNNESVSKLQTKQAVVVEPKNREIIYELAYQKDGEWVEQENNIATVRETEQAQLIVLKSDATFFTSRDGSRSGFLQTVILRRSKDDGNALAEVSPAEKAALKAKGLQEELEMEKAATRKRPRPKP